MLYNVKADSLVTDDIITIQIEADNMYEAEARGWDLLPDVADHGSMWIVPDEWQPYNCGVCYKVEAYSDNKKLCKVCKVGEDYFDSYESAKEFALAFDLSLMYVSCIVDGRLIWLDCAFDKCTGDCDYCRYRSTVPGTDERIDREPAYYCSLKED